ncbi:MAG: metallophosphatase family protein [Planctomycetota bacterium]|jgi:predicted phosphodiesterase|nr:metallophosphatase family protein [Planctomycetota bacterium]
MPDLQEPIAIISDVHANLEALTAVIDDIRAQNIETVYNLGDTVGYGPDPEACIDLVDAACRITLCGNHDYAVLFDADGFNLVARKSIECHRRRLQPDPGNRDPVASWRWKWLSELEPMFEQGGFEAMHGSPRQPITEYVLPSDPENDPLKLAEIYLAMSCSLAFVGHTHFPGVLEEGNDSFIPPFAVGDCYRPVNSRRAIVNVGSVGQPRDRNSRSCYVVYNGECVRYRRIAYDVEKTVKKVLAIPEIHPASGLRLRDGR